MCSVYVCKTGRDQHGQGTNEGRWHIRKKGPVAWVSNRRQGGKEKWDNLSLFLLLPRTHHGTSTSRDSACGDPISITSPSPSASPTASSFALSFHRSRPFPFNREGEPITPLPRPRCPPIVVACDNRLKITELARLTSDFRGVTVGSGVPLSDAFGVVNRAPAEPGLPAPMDDESDDPRKCARAWVGRDTGEWFDVVGVPTGSSLLALALDTDSTSSKLCSDSERLMTRLLRRILRGERERDEKSWRDWERSRLLRRVLFPASVSSQMEGTRVGGRPAEWGGVGRATVGSGWPVYRREYG